MTPVVKVANRGRHSYLVPVTRAMESQTGLR